MARWEFAFQVDRTRGMFVRQIAQALAAEIQRGRLGPGDRLPGSRTLATTLRVHRQTVVTAIDEMIAEGWLISRPGSGTFVAEGLPEPLPGRLDRATRLRRAVPARFALELSAAPEPELPRTAPPRAIVMSGTRPDVRLLPGDLIGRAYRRAIRTWGPELLSYNHPAGPLRLRQGLAAMLSATRGLAVDPHSVLVTRGSQMAWRSRRGR